MKFHGVTEAKAPDGLDGEEDPVGHTARQDLVRLSRRRGYRHNSQPFGDGRLRAATGARHVVAFDHNVRSVEGKRSSQRLAGGQEVQGPALVVHGDYTLTSGPQRLRDLASAPSENDTYRDRLAPGETLLGAEAVEAALAGGRFALINVWRNIAHEPVAAQPLALCDARSLLPEDLVVLEIHYADRVGENYFARHAERHRWVTYPAVTRDEVLLIKQWDSAGELARSAGARSDGEAPDSTSTFSLHSAFVDPATPDDAPPRWSIEVRCVLLYDGAARGA